MAQQSVYIWIVFLPADDGSLRIDSKGQSYILYVEPSQEFINEIVSLGGTVKKVPYSSYDPDLEPPPPPPPGPPDVEEDEDGAYDVSDDTGSFDSDNGLSLDSACPTDSWTITFISNTAFTVTGTSSGLIGSGSTGADLAIAGFFTLLSDYWGGTFSPGDTITFNTTAGAPPTFDTWTEDVTQAWTYENNGEYEENLTISLTSGDATSSASYINNEPVLAVGNLVESGFLYLGYQNGSKADVYKRNYSTGAAVDSWTGPIGTYFLPTYNMDGAQYNFQATDDGELFFVVHNNSGSYLQVRHIDQSGTLSVLYQFTGHGGASTTKPINLWVDRTAKRVYLFYYDDPTLYRWAWEYDGTYDSTLYATATPGTTFQGGMVNDGVEWRVFLSGSPYTISLHRNGVITISVLTHLQLIAGYDIDVSGNIYFLYQRYVSGHWRLYLVKYDDSGSLQWTVDFGEDTTLLTGNYNAQDPFKSVLHVNDLGYSLTSYYDSSDAKYYTSLVNKLGTTEWTREGRFDALDNFNRYLTFETS